MRVTLHGAAGGEVTGSAYHVQTDAASLLVDFGMFQGIPNVEDHNHVPPRLDLQRLDTVLVTHAHLDHTGRLPLLPRHGFAGPVRATPATLELMQLVLTDSAKVQAQDIERVNRKRQRAGAAATAPLYTAGDVQALMALGQPVPYHDPVQVAPGMHARFVEAGHILGSTSIQLCVREQGMEKVVVFSGDLGPKGAPMLRDAEPFHRADVVFLESTYGDRDHKPLPETVAELVEILKTAIAGKGKILVPTFAVGRAQVLLTLLGCLFRQGTLPRFPIYLDSPMAIEATRIHERHPELYDEELHALMQEKPLREDLRTVRLSVTADDSKALNDVPGPCLILAGAGMCNAGRILHHLKQNLWRPETHVLIVGYQSEGSIGRQLVDGRKEVSLFGEKIAVRGKVHTLGGFSAHAGQTDLLEWFSHLAPARPRVILTHGETKAREALARLLRERHGIQCESPKLEAAVEI